MSTRYLPSVIAQAALIPESDDFQVSPPIWWHTFAKDWATDSTAQLANTRYHAELGQIQGSYNLAWNQGWHITGDALTGARVMDVVVGGGVGNAWQAFSTAATPWGITTNVIQNNLGGSDTNVQLEILQHTATTAGLQPCMFLFTHSGPDTATPNPSNTYVYLELANGDPAVNYRLAYEWGNPLRLDIATAATNFAWQPCAILSGPMGDTCLFKDIADQTGITATILPDAQRGTLTIQTYKGTLRASAPKPSNNTTIPYNPAVPGPMPTTERYRLTTKNLYGEFYALPLRHQAAQLTTGPRSFGIPIDITQLTAIPNLTGIQSTTQTNTITPTLNTDGSLQISATATLPDAGDGLGSAFPPTLSDILIYIPSQWMQVTPGGWIGQPLPVAQLPVVHVQEEQIWDDANRIARTTGTLTIDNSSRTMDYAYGNYALNLIASNGNATAQRMRGIMGFGTSGVQNSYSDPHRYTTIQFSDFWRKMERPLEQAIVLDGISLTTAILLLADIGQISPQFLTNWPGLAFPPYPTNYPGYILPTGTGLNPRMRFEPERTVISIIAELLSSAGELDPSTGTSTPYYAYFDPYGQFTVQPYNPLYIPVTKAYSTADATGTGMIIGEPMVVNNSIEQIRTHIVLQGQDAATYELLQYSQELPWNYSLVGYRLGALERNARYGSRQQMQFTAATMAVEASLGTQIVRIQVPFDPNVYAGNVISISDQRLGTGLYNIIRMTSVYGVEDPTASNGATACYSWITARSLQNSYVPFS